MVIPRLMNCLGQSRTYTRECASIPQLHHRQGYTSLIQRLPSCLGTEAFHHPVVPKFCIFCAPEEEEKGGQGSQAPSPELLGAVLAPGCDAPSALPAWHNSLFPLGVQGTPKTKIGTAQICWQTLLCQTPEPKPRHISIFTLIIHHPFQFKLLIFFKGEWNVFFLSRNFQGIKNLFCYLFPHLWYRSKSSLNLSLSLDSSHTFLHLKIQILIRSRPLSMPDSWGRIFFS